MKRYHVKTSFAHFFTDSWILLNWEKVLLPALSSFCWQMALYPSYPWSDTYFRRYLYSVRDGGKADRQLDIRNQPRSQFSSLSFFQVWEIIKKIEVVIWWDNYYFNIVFNESTKQLKLLLPLSKNMQSLLNYIYCK